MLQFSKQNLKKLDNLLLSIQNIKISTRKHTNNCKSLHMKQILQSYRIFCLKKILTQTVQYFGPVNYYPKDTTSQS